MEFLEGLLGRFKSPLFSYLAFSFVAWNWKSLLFLVFGDASLLGRFEYFDLNTSWLTLILGPLVTGVAAFVAYPFVMMVLSRITRSAEYSMAVGRLEKKYDLRLEEVEKQEELQKREDLLKARVVNEGVELARKLAAIEDEAVKEGVRADLTAVRQNPDVQEEILTPVSQEERNAMILKNFQDLAASPRKVLDVVIAKDPAIDFDIYSPLNL